VKTTTSSSVDSFRVLTTLSKLPLEVLWGKTVLDFPARWCPVKIRGLRRVLQKPPDGAEALARGALYVALASHHHRHHIRVHLGACLVDLVVLYTHISSTHIVARGFGEPTNVEGWSPTTLTLTIGSERKFHLLVAITSCRCY